MQKFDITGREFGYLTVISRDLSTIGERNSKWICLCKCGKTTVTTRSSLITGHTTSCGCKHYESKNFTHKMTKTRIYRTWNNMRNRCRYKLKKSEKYYGMDIYKPWYEDFSAFYNWSLENGYSDELSIDRIDNSKGYFPDNCRWVTMKEQQRNKTNNIKITYEGKEYCLKNLCEKLNFPYKLAYERYSKMVKKGQTITNEKLFAPVQTKYHKKK